MHGGGGGMEKNHFWGVKLDAEHKEAKWENTTTENPDECTVCSHTLCVRQAVLGAEAKDEVHVIEIETLGYQREKIKMPVCVIKPGGPNVVSMEVLLEDQKATFHLTKGSGPVYLNGSHQTETAVLTDDYADESIGEEEGEEEEDEEDEIEEMPVKKKPRK
ncbi:Nucleoplasmin/nucleophosmin domain [Halocaridina rubra]|uniref:Nucleoplasmin/nucleophosmin domain n=1 Tax=Halocaridina rubra TaxID=373956 RepID=A0AAN8XL44_HALRR